MLNKSFKDLIRIIETTGLTMDEVIAAGEQAKVAQILQKVSVKHQARVDAGETFEDEPTALANSGPRERLYRRKPGKSALLNPPNKKR